MQQERQGPTALISYSHDSAQHMARVLALANRLRADGVDCEVDQYVPGGAPPEGWPRWMQSRIEQSDFVLMVCSDVYARRVLRQEPVDVGRGVIWEANLLYNLLYFDDTFKRRTIPIIIEGGEVRHVPLPFRDGYCDLRAESGYRELLQRIFGIPGAAKPELGPGTAREFAPPVAATVRFDPELLERLQTALVDALGPIARQVVERTSRRAQTVADLVERLAGEIPDAKDAAAFRARVRADVYDAGRHAAPAVVWDPDLLQRARKELAQHIGPMAKVVVDRVAREARTRRDLIESLAGEIAAPEDRRRFLAAFSGPD